LCARGPTGGGSRQISGLELRPEPQADGSRLRRISFYFARRYDPLHARRNICWRSIIIVRWARALYAADSRGLQFQKREPRKPQLSSRQLGTPCLNSPAKLFDDSNRWVEDGWFCSTHCDCVRGTGIAAGFGHRGCVLAALVPAHRYMQSRQE